MAMDTLTITDNRTGKSYELEIKDGAISAMALRQIKVSDDDFGMMSYDPAYKNTASCRSNITFIDGGKGILRYRGYPIEQLAEKASFLEVVYLLQHGELPTEGQCNSLVKEIKARLLLPEKIRTILDGFHHEAHAMSVTMACVAALRTFSPDAKDVLSPATRKEHALRLVAQIPTIAAFAYRHRIGLPYIYPDSSLSYAGNFLQMMFRTTERDYTPNPVFEKTLDILFILHADHEQNCSASTMRGVGSSQADPYSSAAAAIAALFGPLHGGANEAVLRMLRKIGRKENIPAFLEEVKAGKGRLMGFGHRVYKAYDPRARIIQEKAHEVFAVTGKNPMLDIALELEKIALHDDYFLKRRLYPNVDFYSGLIYQALGFPVEMFPVLFAIGRMPGWLAQWQEMLEDREQRIARPRQIYVGEGERDVIPMDRR